MNLVAAARPVPSRWVGLVPLTAVLAGIAVAVAGPAVALIAVGGAVAVVAMVRAPGIVLAAYLLIPLYKGALDPYLPFDITMVLAAANGAQAIALVASRRSFRTSRLGLALWVALAVLVLAGATYAPDQSLALGKAITYWVLVLAAITPAAIRVGTDLRWVRQLLYACFVIGVVTVLVGLGQLSASTRLTVLGMNTIQVARAALLAPVVGIALIVPQRRLVLTVLVTLMVPLSIVVALASGSRGPILMLLALALIGGAQHIASQRSRAWRPIVGAIALALLSIAVFAMVSADLPAAALGRFGSLANFLSGSGSTGGVAGAETSAAARVSFAGFALEMFMNSPLVGAGTAGFQALFQGLHGADAAAYPHNALVQVAAEYGLVGLAVFLGVVLAAFTRRLPGGSTTRALWALATFFALNALVSGDIFTGRETLGLILLLLVVSDSGTAETGARVSPGPVIGPPRSPRRAQAAGMTHAPSSIARGRRPDRLDGAAPAPEPSG